MKTYKIIKVDSYLLAIDQIVGFSNSGDFKQGDWVWSCTSGLVKWVVGDMRIGYGQVLAHLPLSTGVLEGVPLLPPLNK